MPDPKLHYSEQGSPRCGTQGQVTDKKSLVTCVRCRKAMKKKQNWMKQADDLFARMIKERDGRCIAAGVGPPCSGYLQCAHILSRSYKTIRTDEDNAVALCAAHHYYFTPRPLEWEEWVRANFPGRWEALRAKALTYAPVDWKAEVARLSD